LALDPGECQDGGVVPTYEYRCKDCGAELEVVQSFTDDALTTCAACGGSLRKVFGNVGISFKGSGFYKTDSRNGSSKTSSSSSSDTKADSTSDSTSDTSSDKKADKKADKAAATTSSTSSTASS
jgi:putative FmdB family regulatory protein